MKKLVTAAALLISTLSFGQTTPDTITIASHKLAISADCTIEGETKIRCEGYSLAWIYGDKQTVKGLQNALLEMGGMLTNFKKKRVDFYLFDRKCKGYTVSYKNATGTTYQLSVSGVINNKPVWVLVDLNEEPVTNASLPEFIRQIIRFPQTRK